jgi:hypothetical protein
MGVDPSMQRSNHINWMTFITVRRSYMMGSEKGGISKTAKCAVRP